MNLILDTHVFLWYLQDDDQLTSPIANILESTENKPYLSIASLWEIAIKLGIGKLDLEYSFDELYGALNQFDIQILPIEFLASSAYGLTDYLPPNSSTAIHSQYRRRQQLAFRNPPKLTTTQS